MSNTVQLQEQEGVSYLDTFVEYMDQFTDPEKDDMQVSAGVLYKVVKELQEKIEGIESAHPFILVKIPFKYVNGVDGREKFDGISNGILKTLTDFGWGSVVLPDAVDKMEFHQFDVQGLEKLDVKELSEKIDQVFKGKF